MYRSENSLERIMFDDIGVKIQKVAKAIAWFDIGVSILAGVILFFIGLLSFNTVGYFILLAPLVILSGSIAAWLSVIALYGFGKLIEDTEAIRTNTAGIRNINANIQIITETLVSMNAEHASGKSKELANRIAEENAKRAAQEQAKRIADEKAKQEAEEYAKRIAEETRKYNTEESIVNNTEKPVCAKKEKTLTEELAYALQFHSDEGMISYLKGIDSEVVKDILKSPNHTIRKQIELIVRNS